MRKAGDSFLRISGSGFGKEVFTFEDVCAFAEEVADDEDTTKDKRQRLRKRMHKYLDDKSCQRILEAFHIIPESK